jgi:hypothetical protein
MPEHPPPPPPWGIVELIAKSDKSDKEKKQDIEYILKTLS